MEQPNMGNTYVIDRVIREVFRLILRFHAVCLLHHRYPPEGLVVLEDCRFMGQEVVLMAACLMLVRLQVACRSDIRGP